jgi:predicted ATPase/DNA-binding winged helix-turn-helix (wHTH) protein
MAAAWVFGDIEIRPAERRVLRAGVPQALGGRAFDLLLALIERRGEVLSKDELMRQIWPGLVVEENNLTVHMSALRKAIGPAAISTVPGRGYQFIADMAPLADSDSAPMGNLPAQTTRFVGRDADLAAVVAVLDTARMVTLTGIGGIGKTRLSLQVAAAAAPGFADGAWLVELASVVHPLAVVHAVAGALGVPQQAGKTMEQSLIEALRRRHVLLVLDNCEHLVDTVAALAQSLLAGCAQLTLLATSREALMVAGEQNWPVPSLSVAAGQASAAVELFVERARGVTADFELGEHAAAVTEICRQLDGLPLAIELAAARVRAMTPAQIRDRLDQRFALLTGAPRGVEKRHQTLRHAVQWSYDLLSPAEQVVLARVSVFAGGFTLQAAERVCEGPYEGNAIASSDVLDLLDSLARKSMLTVGRGAEGIRFGMLETMRQFAEDRLVNRHEAAATRRTHARFMAEDSDRQFRVWRSPRQRQAHDWLDREMGNLRLAFRWAMQHADVDVAARIASNIGDMARHCLRDETAGWAAEVVEAARKVRHRRLCVLLNWAGSSACGSSRFDEARRFALEAVALADDPDFDPLVWAYVDLAYVELSEGRSDRAIDWLRLGAAHPADRQDRYAAACLLAIMASGEDASEARRLSDGIVRNVDGAGVPCSIVVAYIGKGEVLAEVDPTAALTAMSFAIATAQASGCRFLESYFTPRFAVLQALHGDAMSALRSLERMREAWSVSTDAAVVAAWRGGVVVLLARLGRFDQAATVHGTLDEAMKGTALLAHLDAAARQIRDALDPPDFSNAMKRGAAMTPLEADDYALSCLRQALAAHAGSRGHLAPGVREGLVHDLPVSGDA